MTGCPSHRRLGRRRRSWWDQSKGCWTACINSWSSDHDREREDETVPCVHCSYATLTLREFGCYAAADAVRVAGDFEREVRGGVVGIGEGVVVERAACGAFDGRGNWEDGVRVGRFVELQGRLIRRVELM